MFTVIFPPLLTAPVTRKNLKSTFSARQIPVVHADMKLKSSLYDHDGKLWVTSDMVPKEVASCLPVTDEEISLLVEKALLDEDTVVIDFANYRLMRQRRKGCIIDLTV